MDNFFSDLPEEKSAGWGDDPDEGGAASPENDDGINVRIARTGRMVREETKRLLAQESLVRRRLPAIKPERFPKQVTEGLTDEEKAELIEVTDDSDKPLMCLRPESAIRQKLPYRLVAVALCRGAGRLVLHKRQDSRLGHAGCWDLHTAFVLAGEAREDAALRILRRAGLQGIGVKALQELPPDGERRARTSYFTAQLPAGLYPSRLAFPANAEDGQKRETDPESSAAFEIAEVLEVDSDELAGITAEVPELFSPEVLWAARTELLFAGKKSRADY